MISFPLSCFCRSTLLSLSLMCVVVVVCLTSLTIQEKDMAVSMGIQPYSWNEFLQMKRTTKLRTKREDEEEAERSDWNLSHLHLSGKLPSMINRCFKFLEASFLDV